jgi:hypothetical protein
MKKSSTDPEVVKIDLAPIFDGPDVILDRFAAAKFLGIAESTLDLLIKAGRIPSSVHDGSRVFSRDRLRDYEPSNTPEALDEVLRRKLLECEYIDALATSISISEQAQEMFKRGLAGEKVQRWEEEDIIDKTIAADAEKQRLLRLMDEDAGLGWLYAKEDAEKKAKAADRKRRQTQVQYVPNNCGGMDRLPLEKPAKEDLDFSKQVQIYPHDEVKGRGR